MGLIINIFGITGFLYIIVAICVFVGLLIHNHIKGTFKDWDHGYIGMLLVSIFWLLVAFIYLEEKFSR